MKSFIYCLEDPITGEIRYVGKTNDPLKRFSSHYRRSTEDSWKSNWVKSLKRRGLKPRMEILEEVDGDWVRSERFWIAYLKFLGCRLTNLTNGGEGAEGLRHSIQTRERMSKQRKGRPVSLGSIKALVHFNPRCPSMNCRMAVSRVKLGVPLSEDVKRRLSESLKGRYFTPEHRRKISIAKKGKVPFYKNGHPMKGRVGPGAKRVKVYKGGVFLEEMNSLQSASTKYGPDVTSIIKVCQGSRKTSGGFSFKYSSSKSMP